MSACRACLPVDPTLSTPGQPAAVCARTLATPPAEPCGARDFEPLPQADLTRGGQLARDLDDAVARLPRLSLNERVAEAERHHATRKASEAHAREVTRAAARRCATDPATAARTAAAATIAAPWADDDARDDVLTAAAVALELAERDRPSAEAALGRVRELAAAWLASPHLHHQDAATAVLNVLAETAGGGVAP